MRYWSLLFALAAIFSVGAFVYAPFSPTGGCRRTSTGGCPTSSRRSAREIDSLFVIILWITGIVFIGTQVALVWATCRFADDRPGRACADYFHGSQRLEVIWTIIPAAILVFIALYQMGTWASIKFRSPQPKVQPLAEVTGRQFQWVMRYPGPDGQLHTTDDLFTVNDLHFVKEQDGADLPEVDRRAALVLPAADADQAGRRAGPDDPGLVRLRPGGARTSWSAPSCAAGATTRCGAT